MPDNWQTTNGQWLPDDDCLTTSWRLPDDCLTTKNCFLKDLKNIFFSQVNFGKKAVALAVRQIKAGAEINDSYGAVYHHMDKAERQQFLQVSW